MRIPDRTPSFVFGLTCICVGVALALYIIFPTILLSAQQSSGLKPTPIKFLAKNLRTKPDRGGREVGGSAKTHQALQQSSLSPHTSPPVFTTKQPLGATTSVKVVVAIPSRPNGACTWGKRLADRSLNPQTVPPARVILSITALQPLSDAQLLCIKTLRELLTVPLELAFELGPPSEGAGRNLAMRHVAADESVQFHDDDDVIHPQAIELLTWALQTYPDTDVVVWSYVFQWGRGTHRGSITPWCKQPATQFKALFTSTDIAKNVGSNLMGKRLDTGLNHLHLITFVLMHG